MKNKIEFTPNHVKDATKDTWPLKVYDEIRHKTIL